MKELTGTAVNFLTRMCADKTWMPSAEIILLVSEPQYRIDANGGLVKSRTIDSLRFVVSIDGLKKLSEDMMGWVKDAEKEEAK